MERDTRGGPRRARVQVDVMRRSERDRQLSFSGFLAAERRRAVQPPLVARSTVCEGKGHLGRRYERPQRLTINLAKAGG